MLVEDLLQSLRQSVEAVKVKYGFHSGLAVEEDYCVSNLCRNLENILIHQAKFRRTGLLNKETDDDILAWDLISRFLSKTEIIRFENEVSLTSGIGRFRSWLRSTLNDGLTGKYLTQIHSTETSLLRFYYDDGSVMLDREIVMDVMRILEPLSTVLFSFDLDRPDFNTPLVIDRTMSATILIPQPSTAQKCSPAPVAGKGKRKMKRPEIADITDTDSGPIASPNSLLVTPQYQTLVAPPSLPGGEDLDLVSLLGELIPKQSEVSSTSSEEEEIPVAIFQEPDKQDVKEENDKNCTVSKPDSLKVPENDCLERSFELGTLPDTECGSSKTFTLNPPLPTCKESEFSTPYTSMSDLSDLASGLCTPADGSEQAREEVGTSPGSVKDSRNSVSGEVVIAEDAPDMPPRERSLVMSWGRRLSLGRTMLDTAPDLRVEEGDVRGDSEIQTRDAQIRDEVGTELGVVVEDGTSEDEQTENVAQQPPISDALPRSSSVICKPYSPSVARIINSRDSVDDASNAVIPTPSSSSTMDVAMSPYDEHVINDHHDDHVTEHVAESSVSDNASLISSSVPADAAHSPLRLMVRRSQSVQLPERLPPLGGSVRSNYDADEFSNSDAVSLCSDISSVRDYATSVRSTGDGIEYESGSGSNCGSLGITQTASELRGVLTALLQQKEDIEHQNRQLQETLERETSTRAALKLEIQQMQNTFIQRQSHDQTVIRGLQRENQMLKQQLKKYVSVVQRLRRDDRIPSDHDLASVLVEVPVIQPLQLPSAQVNTNFDNSALEQKLAQVSEMHGELLELNQQLISKNLAREKQLQDMEKKLSDIEVKEADKREKRSDKRIKAKETNINEYQLVDSPLLQLWIPAAMVRGSGATKHHVYQVVLQVGGEQWSVYRRYAEFRAFHKQLVQKYSYFGKLEFPGRTHFNRKVPSVVEERRAKLELYLQRVTHCLADNKQGLNIPTMDLNVSPFKACVTSAIHFFREQETTPNDDVYPGF